MHSKKYLQMLGMARRAGKVAMGHDMAMKSLAEKKAKLLIIASDMSPRLNQEFARAADRFCPHMVCCRISDTIDDLHRAMGYRAGVLTVNDENFANRIIQLINQEEDANGN
ncbi:MAG: ribosomal L7Ae/L30e/S12e/Gadd45 family protein [Eubacteriales bacterium]|nr:ribosomal L7Ae/L30e/S12e/Gadd45 family protein [Eubacteriales bacterium]